MKKNYIKPDLKSLCVKGTLLAASDGLQKTEEQASSDYEVLSKRSGLWGWKDGDEEGAEEDE